MTDKIVLITGASRGLGAALAQELAQSGTHIVVLGQTTGGLEEVDDVIHKKGASSSIAVMDMASDSCLATLTEKIKVRWGRLDLLIHAAIHAPPLSPVALGDQKEFVRAFHINVLATENLIARCQPLLKNSPHAAAVFFDDPRGGEKFFGHYGSTKSAQIALVQSWKSESRQAGISVIVVEPQPMKTRLRCRFFPGENPDSLIAPQIEAQRILNLLRRDEPEKLGWLPRFTLDS